MTKETFISETAMAERIIELQMYGIQYKATEKSLFMEDKPMPLPPTFLRLLRDALSRRGVGLLGVTKSGNVYAIRTTKGNIRMNGVFSVNNVMEKL